MIAIGGDRIGEPLGDLSLTQGALACERLKVDRDAEVPLLGEIEERLENLVRGVAGPPPRRDETVDAGILRLLDMPFHRARIAGDVGHEGPVAQHCARPVLATVPRIVERPEQLGRRNALNLGL